MSIPCPSRSPRVCIAFCRDNLAFASRLSRACLSSPEYAHAFCLISDQRLDLFCNFYKLISFTFSRTLTQCHAYKILCKQACKEPDLKKQIIVCVTTKFIALCILINKRQQTTSKKKSLRSFSQLICMLWVYMERGRGRKDKMRAQKIFSTQNTT